MRPLLVAGANGQLGWELRRQAMAFGYPCLSLTRAELDISDRVAVLQAVEEMRPAVIVNAAAYTAVDRAESEKEIAYAVNRNGAAHLAEGAARAGVPLIHISTDYVYDGLKHGHYVEDDPVSPINVYGASKLAGEEAVRQICAQHIILRTSWVFGVHGHNFVRTMLRLAAERERLRVVDDQHGSPTFAGDLAGAILALTKRLESGEDEGWGTFHCAGRGATTWCRFAQQIFALSAPVLGRAPEVLPITTAEFPTPARRPANSVLDCGRLGRIHGIFLRSWQTALAEMLDCVLQQTFLELSR